MPRRDSNTHSTQPPDRLAGLAAANQALADEDLDQLPDAALTSNTQRLEQLLDSLQGQWLRRVAAVDASGAAGADPDHPAPTTASWLRGRLRMGVGAARSSVRTARALFRGPPHRDRRRPDRRRHRPGPCQGDRRRHPGAA